MLRHCIVTNCLIFGLLFFILRNATNSSALTKTFFVMIGVQLLTSIIPTLCVHLQYLLKNRNACLVIDKLNRELNYLTRADNRQKTNYLFENIVSLEYCCSFGLASSGWYSFAGYDYCKIKFKDNSVITVTCLLMEDVKENLESLFRIEAETKKKIIAFI